MEKSDTGWICKQINAIKSQNKMWEDTKPYSNSLNTVNKFPIFPIFLTSFSLNYIKTDTSFYSTKNLSVIY